MALQRAFFLKTLLNQVAFFEMLIPKVFSSDSWFHWSYKVFYSMHSEVNPGTDSVVTVKYEKYLPFLYIHQSVYWFSCKEASQNFILISIVTTVPTGNDRKWPEVTGSDRKQRQWLEISSCGNFLKHRNLEFFHFDLDRISEPVSKGTFYVFIAFEITITNIDEPSSEDGMKTNLGKSREGFYQNFHKRLSLVFTFNFECSL